MEYRVSISFLISFSYLVSLHAMHSIEDQKDSVLFYDPAKKVTNKTCTQQVQKVLVGLNMVDEAIDAFQKRDLRKFDGSIGDKACHVLSAIVTDLALNPVLIDKLKLDKKITQEGVDSLGKVLLQKKCKTGKEGVLLHRFLIENKINLDKLSAQSNFLGALYFLTKYSSVGTLAPTSVDDYGGKASFTLQKDFPGMSKNSVQDLFKQARSLVNRYENAYLDMSCERIKMLKGESPGETYFSCSKLDAKEWTPEFIKKIPDFVVFKMLCDGINEKLYAIVVNMICNHHPEGKTLHVGVLPFRNFKRHSLTECDSKEPCHTAQGVSVLGSETKELLGRAAEVKDLIKTLKREPIKSCIHAQKHMDNLNALNLKEWIIAGGADHPQGYYGTLDEASWKREDALAFHDELASYKRKAKTLCSQDVVRPLHDMPDTVEELVKLMDKA